MRAFLFAICILCLACGDDTTPPAVDASTGTDSGGGTDAGGTDAGSPDAGGVECFGLSGATMAEPFAIPGSLGATSPTWARPDGDDCPTAGVTTEQFPYETVCFRNDTGGSASFLFEVVADLEDTPSMMVIYDGDGIAADPTQCRFISPEPIIGNLAETSLTLEDGADVLLVATMREAAEGTFVFVATPE